MDYTGGIAFDGSLPLRNDELGCCVPVASLQLARIRQQVCMGSTWTPTDALAESVYRPWGLWDGTPATDKGCDVHFALDLWAAKGIWLGDQLLDIGEYVSVDPTDLDAVRAAVDFGTGALFTVALRESDFDTTRPWAVTSAPSIGGHQVMCPKFDAGAFYVVTWDCLAEVPVAAMAQRLIAVQVPVSKDLLATTGLSPEGMTFAETLAQLSA